MITYMYWFIVFAFAVCALYFLGRARQWKPAVISALVILAMGWGSYVFYFENLFVKRYGGVMTITMPKGQMHIASTWKDDNLWVENYDPKTNTCYFYEYSRGNLLQGKVTIRNCNPVSQRLTPVYDSGKLVAGVNAAERSSSQ